MFESMNPNAKRILEFVSVTALVVVASATSFIWFPVSAAAAAVALLGVVLGWAIYEVWTWHYDSSFKVHPLAKINRKQPPPSKPIIPAA